MKLKQRQLFGRFDNFLIFSRFFLELRSKGLYPSSEQEKENRCLAFTFFTKCGRATTAKNCTKKCISLPCISLHDYDVVQVPRFMKT